MSQNHPISPPIFAILLDLAISKWYFVMENLINHINMLAMKKMKTIILSSAIFISSICTCFASGGTQSLEKTVKEAKLIFKAIVTEVKKGSDKWGHLNIKAEKIEDVKGDLKGKSLLLNFQAMEYEQTVDGIKSWNMVPQSGKELKMKKDEVWIFFSHSDLKDDKGFIYIFRAEPVDQEKKIRDLLKKQN